MFEPLRLAEIDRTRLPGRIPVRLRNLGAAMLVAAVEDYQGPDPDAHESAAVFLYPCTDEDREHLEWAVRMADDLNPAWFREMLDKSRMKWDVQRRVQ